MERKRWKEDLIARIAAGIKAEPVPISPVDPGVLAKAKSPAGEDMIVLPSEYMHVAVRGRFHHDKEQYLYAPTPEGLGWHVFTPLELAAEPERLVWINRGFVPDARKAPAVRPEGQVPGEVEVRGLVRKPPAKGLFTPENDASHNLWHWPDLAAMTRAAFQNVAPPGPGGPGQSAQPAKAWPIFIEADAQPAPPGGLPKRRRDAARPAQPAPRICADLVWLGRNPGGCLFGLCDQPVTDLCLARQRGRLAAWRPNRLVQRGLEP
jgi:hypothetical protein